MFRNRPHSGFERQGEALSKIGADVVVPCACVQQVLIRLWGPDYWIGRGFLNRPALTCCHGITSEGFCSCRVMR